MKLLRYGFVALVFASTCSFAQNPVPFIGQPLVPTAAAPGGSGFTLTVNGTGFVSGSVVNWNGTPLTTVLVSSAQLTATVPASNVATAQTASITVVNPSPGGGTSNVAFFQVMSPESAVAFTGKGSATANISGEVTADFNGDGKLDLAIATYSPNQISILLGNGDGTLQAPVSYPLPPISANQIVTGDFNGDGKLDMVIGQSLLLGNGDGTFQPAISLIPYLPTDGIAAAAGDFNRDGKLDLLGAVPMTGLFVVLGNGDGTFQPTTVFYFCGTVDPTVFGVADFNNDGKLDMLGWNRGGICVYLGNGDGTFTSVQEQIGRPFTYPVAIADFNDDGKQDLLLSGLVVGIALGNGDGTFQQVRAFNDGNCGVNSGPSGPVGDFNGDGKLDFAGSGIFLGNGDGSFEPCVAYSQVSGFTGTGDFNGDGKLDLLSGTIVELQTSDFSLAASPMS